MPTAATTTASSDQNRLKLPTRLHDEAKNARPGVISITNAEHMSMNAVFPILSSGESASMIVTSHNFQRRTRLFGYVTRRGSRAASGEPLCESGCHDHAAHN